jgi:hypothetical protein
MTCMASARATNFLQKRVANPSMRRNPLQTLLETTGRTSDVRAFVTNLLTVLVDLH